MLLECCVGLVGDSTEWFSLWWLCPGEADFLFSLSPWLTHFHSSHNAPLMQQLNCRNYCHLQIFYTSLDISFLSVTKFWKPHFDKNQGLCFLSTVKYFKFIPLTVKLLKITKIFQLIFTKIISVYFHQNYFGSFSPKLFPFIFTKIISLLSIVRATVGLILEHDDTWLDSILHSHWTLINQGTVAATLLGFGHNISSLWEESQ